jgi:hypothetical protein
MDGLVYRLLHGQPVTVTATVPEPVEKWQREHRPALGKGTALTGPVREGQESVEGGHRDGLTAFGGHDHEANSEGEYRSGQDGR